MRLYPGTDIVRAAWMRLDPLARWLLLALGRRPETVTLGDLRALRGES